jgi:hypothetical protein
MRVALTRDGVCQGDDADAHERGIVLQDGLSLKEIVVAISEADYLPTIAGGRATWGVISRVPIAVIAQQRRRPRMMGSIPSRPNDLDYRDGALRCHLMYFADLSPRLAARILLFPSTVEALLRESRESGEERISLADLVNRFKSRMKTLPRQEEINEALYRIDWIVEESEGGELFLRFSSVPLDTHAEIRDEEYFWEDSVWRTRGWDDSDVAGRTGFSVPAFWLRQALDRFLP